MKAKDSAHEDNDVCLAGVLIIAILSMLVGVMIGFLIAS